MSANLNDVIENLDGFLGDFPPLQESAGLDFGTYIDFEPLTFDFDNFSVQSLSSSTGTSLHTAQADESLGAIPLSPVPEALASELTKLDPVSNYVQILTALSQFAPPAPASKSDFCRRYPAWKEPLHDIIYLAITAAYYIEPIIPLDGGDSHLRPIMARYTPLAIVMIFHAMQENGHALHEKDLEALHYMSSIVQWAIDALIEFHDIVRRDGRKLGHVFWLQDVHLDANEVFNSLTWEWVFLHDLRSNQGHLCDSRVWRLVLKSFYACKTSIGWHVYLLHTRYPKLLDYYGINMFTHTPRNAFYISAISLYHRLRELRDRALTKNHVKLPGFDVYDQGALTNLNAFILAKQERLMILWLKCKESAKFGETLVKSLSMSADGTSGSGDEN